MPRSSDNQLKPPQRLWLPLTDDGTQVDWAHVRPSTAARFEGLLKTDPNIRKAYQEENGIREDEEPFDLGLSEENVRKLLDGITTVNAMIFQLAAAKWIKHPFAVDANGKKLPFILEPESLRHMHFTDAQHRELDPRATKVAKKYEGKMPDWLKEHFDLYVFGAMFISYTAENAKATITAQVRRDMERAKENYARAQARDAAVNRPPDSDVPPSPTNGVDRNPPIDLGEAGQPSV